ncbi:MAG: glycosyltransferase family 4 protein [Pseudomonadota bacterium]
MNKMMKVLLFANTDWYLYNFRLPLAKYFKEKGLEVVLVSPSGPYGICLKEQGFRWISIPMQRHGLNPWTEIKLLKHIAKIYADEKPDLVHHFTIKCVLYGSLAARIVGIKRRVNAITGLGHVFTSNKLQMRLLRPFVRNLFRIAFSGRNSRLILQNPDDYQAIVKAHLAQSEYMRLIRGSGVDTERFQPRLPVEKTPNVFRVLLAAARLVREKGVGEYAEAARILKRSNQKFEFILAGLPDIGHLASITPIQIAEWQREGIITVLGNIDDMVSLLNNVDLVVLPSYREGLPRGLLEAAACSLPIVTTNAPGCREVVEHGVNGLLVPCKNSQALAKAIQYFIDNPQERARMGAAGRTKVLKEFDQKIVLKNTFEVYKELLPLPELNSIPIPVK